MKEAEINSQIAVSLWGGIVVVRNECWMMAAIEGRRANILPAKARDIASATASTSRRSPSIYPLP